MWIWRVRPGAHSVHPHLHVSAPNHWQLSDSDGQLDIWLLPRFRRVELFLPSDYSGERILLFLSAWLAERPTGSISAFEFTRQDQRDGTVIVSLAFIPFWQALFVSIGFVKVLTRVPVL